ncbi:hypothetical protein THRCLA_04356 [Thraustotheca clavata]|uniref:PX domain-containing protein n=1 Tax=Thraustotheca clavata TaxID=74557 RepID=A0A1W0A003_9STRA|nr:hypothetical protein THRCLA_04356 [Thraustotheca clavata]
MRLIITAHSKIRSSSSLSSPIVFHIHVEEMTPKKKEYVVCKRFRDFVNLRTYLINEGFNLPSLPLTGPAMSLWMAWNKEEALQYRVDSLQELLECINISEEMQACPSFQSFIGGSPDQKRGYTSLSGFRTAESFRIVDLSKSSCIQLPKRSRSMI